MEISYFVLFPEIVLSITAILILLFTPRGGAGKLDRSGQVALLGIFLALVTLLYFWNQSGSGFFGMVVQDGLAQFSRLLFLFSSGAVIVLGRSYLSRESLRTSDFMALLLFATVGMCLMVTSSDLIMTFLGIEVLSIASYVLAGFRDAPGPAESSWKYFILGAFSTAFLLYGIAFLYGTAGSTSYSMIAEHVTIRGASPGLLAGLGLLLVGFGFKAALVPFHVWTPDVYEGAPVPVTGFLAVASKAAAFLTLLRILDQVLAGVGGEWQMLLWLSAVLTMALGNIAALAQTNIKRMLAYSSIAHAGYLLVGLAARNQLGAGAVLFYLASYGFMTLGAFAVVQILACPGERHVTLSDYTGIGFRYPFLSVSLSVFLFSMAGIPSTAGFMGKLLLFSAAIKGNLYWLVVLGLLATVLGVYYYLRVIVLMFMREDSADHRRVELPLPVRITIGFMLAGTIGLGIFPGPLMELVNKAVQF